ncbi:MAG: nicotinate-nucleotide adenylyltransferase [Sphingobacteriia bacterium]|nr:nicotinate-nucleotide adenylyltransferase [Sphingobacteriia bacterium]
MEKTGLFFGSFNPIHIGHLIIAGYMQQFTDLQEIWFVVSPHNPLKEKQGLLEATERFEMVKMAIVNNPGFKAIDIEFYMPTPSYTINTLLRLTKDFPDREFIIVAGTDIFEQLHKWKEYKSLLSNYHFYIYNRPGYSIGEYAGLPSVHQFNTPIMEISSSFIRKAIFKGKDVRYMLPESVWKYLMVKGLYSQTGFSPL